MKKQIVLFSVFTLMFCFSRQVSAQTNKVAKFTSTTMPSGLTQSLIFDNGTNVGIGTGTITPTNKLEINGAANQLKLTAATAGQEASMLFSPGGTLNAWQTGVSSAVAGNGWWVYENTANAYRMVVKQGGKVGIGTTNPSYKLCISNAGASGVEIDAVGGANGGGFIQGYNRATSAYIPMSSYALSHHFFIGNFEKMTIQASTGNVGIGTTNPLSYSKLDVRGGALNVVNYTTNGYGYIGRKEVQCSHKYLE